jgi:hypothetical protein
MDGCAALSRENREELASPSRQGPIRSLAKSNVDDHPHARTVHESIRFDPKTFVLLFVANAFDGQALNVETRAFTGARAPPTKIGDEAHLLRVVQLRCRDVSARAFFGAEARTANRLEM